MRTYLNFISSLVVTLAMVQTANSDIVVSLTNEIDAAGTNATVTVSIADTEARELTNFNLPIDVGNDDAFSSQNDFVFNGFTDLSFGNVDVLNAAPIANFDLTSAGSGSPITLSETPTELFSLNFSINPSVPVGTTFPISLQTEPIVAGTAFPGFFTLTLDSTPIEADDAAFADVEVSNGTITVAAAVPEPSGIALLAVGACGIAARRRRRNA